MGGPRMIAPDRRQHIGYRDPHGLFEQQLDIQIPERL
jgi:hypothetical protein